MMYQNSKCKYDQYGTRRKSDTSEHNWDEMVQVFVKLHAVHVSVVFITLLNVSNISMISNEGYNWI